MGNIKRNFFDQPTAGGRSGHQYRQNRRDENEKPKTPVPEVVKNEPKKPVKIYNALPTVSGLKLDQKLLATLIDMGFDRGLATQALQESDNGEYKFLFCFVSFYLGKTHIFRRLLLFFQLRI